MENKKKEKFCVNRKKKLGSSRNELLEMEKEDLVDHVLRLEAHNAQLRNIIKSGGQLSEDSPQHKKGRPFDFSKCHSRRVLLRVAYLGWDWLGFVTQEDTTRTIEHQLFTALTRTCLVESREKAGYHRCGRTDKGVSSFGQVISLSLRSKFPPAEQNCEDNVANEFPYCKMLNRLLPGDIRAVCWMPLPLDRPDFSARFDCIKREYRYYFPRGDLDLTAMAAGCARVVGAHDFRNLCKMDVGNAVTEFVRRIDTCRIVPVDDDTDEATSMYYVHVVGDAFLWHQIRCVVGVLLLVAQRRETPDVLTRLLSVGENPRKPQYSMALDVPLNLFRCRYELDAWVWREDELACLIRRLQAEWTLYSVKATMIKDCLRSLEEQYRNMKIVDADRDEIAADGDAKMATDGDDKIAAGGYDKMATDHDEKMAADGDDKMASGSDDKMAGGDAKIAANGGYEEIRAHAECLLPGIKPKVYKPLMEREKCSSLEEKIDHYKKRRRIEPVPSDK